MGAPSKKREAPKSELHARMVEHWELMLAIYKLIKMNRRWWLPPMFFVFAFISVFFVLGSGSGGPPGRPPDGLLVIAGVGAVRSAELAARPWYRCARTTVSSVTTQVS